MSSQPDKENQDKIVDKITHPLVVWTPEQRRQFLEDFVHFKVTVTQFDHDYSQTYKALLWDKGLTDETVKQHKLTMQYCAAQSIRATRNLIKQYGQIPDDLEEEVSTFTRRLHSDFVAKTQIERIIWREGYHGTSDTQNWDDVDPVVEEFAHANGFTVRDIRHLNSIVALTEEQIDALVSKYALQQDRIMEAMKEAYLYQASLAGVVFDTYPREVM